VTSCSSVDSYQRYGDPAASVFSVEEHPGDWRSKFLRNVSTVRHSAIRPFPFITATATAAELNLYLSASTTDVRRHAFGQNALQIADKSKAARGRDPCGKGLNHVLII
jgi:hypothetical protein